MFFDFIQEGWSAFWTPKTIMHLIFTVEIVVLIVVFLFSALLIYNEEKYRHPQDDPAVKLTKKTCILEIVSISAISLIRLFKGYPNYTWNLFFTIICPVIALFLLNNLHNVRKWAKKIDDWEDREEDFTRNTIRKAAKWLNRPYLKKLLPPFLAILSWEILKEVIEKIFLFD